MLDKKFFIVVQHVLSQEFEKDINIKQCEYIVLNYDHVIKSVMIGSHEYRAMYPVILEEALEYEHGFRKR